MFSFTISPSNEYSGLISFRMDWLDLLTVQGTLKSQALRPGWEMQFTGGKASEPPTGKKRPYCSWTIRLQECVRPYWPQLSYCLSFQTRIRAYLVKGKGLLLSKLPRDSNETSVKAREA